MDPLSVVEERVGAVESWPTYIILHMFVEEPNARTVRNVAGFMYGNQVPVEHAVNCFDACNGLNRSYVAEKIHEWYYVWRRDSYRSHMVEHYNTRLKCNVWINGWELNQEEKVPGAVVSNFGVENSGCPQLIRCTIANVGEEGGQMRRGGILFV
jgi:hypothetical protein